MKPPNIAHRECLSQAETLTRVAHGKTLTLS
jgi:hypothetical protein